MVQYLMLHSWECWFTRDKEKTTCSLCSFKIHFKLFRLFFSQYVHQDLRSYWPYPGWCGPLTINLWAVSWQIVINREMRTSLSILMACFSIYFKYKQHHFCTKYSFSIVADDSSCSHQLQWDQCLAPCQKVMTAFSYRYKYRCKNQLLSIYILNYSHFY